MIRYLKKNGNNPDTKRTMRLFLLNAVLLLLAYGGMYRGTFNGDTLIAEVLPQTGPYLQAGRYLFAMLWEITYRLGWDMGHTSGINVLLALLMMAAAATIIANALYCCQNKTEKGAADFFLYDGVVLLAFLNLLSSELLFFSAYALTSGIPCLFVALAVQDYSRKRNIRCGLWLTAAILNYQAYVGMFMVFALLSLYLQEKGKLNRNTFWKSALTVIVPCLLCAVDIVSTKVLGAMHLIVSAKKSIHTAGIGQTLRTILITQIDILKNEYSLSFLRFLPFVLLAVSGILILRGMIARKAELNEWIYLLLLLLVSNLCTFAVTFGGYLYMTPRVLVSYFSFISLVLYVALYLTGQGSGYRILTGAVAAMLFLETLNANVLVTDLYTSNRLDQNYVMNVEAQVEKYERETGILVQKVGICTDEKVRHYWTEYIDFYNYNINERCTAEDWSFDMVWKRFTNRIYEKIKVPEEIYEQYFAQKDWDSFDAEEQMIFDGDTLYIAIY